MPPTGSVPRIGQASGAEKARILDEMFATTGMGRSSSMRMLTAPVLPHPAEQIDRHRLRSKQYGDDSRALLKHVWALMGMPCGKYLTVMLPIWLAADGRGRRPRHAVHDTGGDR